MNKALRKQISELVKRGWTYVGQNKHIKMRSPKGRTMCLSVTPSCPHAVKHIIKQAEQIERMEKDVFTLIQPTT